MSDLNETCACKEKQYQPEFACNCNASIIFLCNACVVSHLREQRPHSFISPDQARRMLLEGSEFKERYGDKHRTYEAYKSQIHDYLNSIISFKSQIKEFRSFVLKALNSEIHRKINDLKGFETDLKAKLGRLSNSIATSDFSEFAKYEANEKGILAEYPEVFRLCKDEEINLRLNVLMNEPGNQKLKSIINAQKAELGNLNRKIKEYKNAEESSKLRIQQLTQQLEHTKSKIKEYEDGFSYYNKLEQDYKSKIQEPNESKDEKDMLLIRMASYENTIKNNDIQINQLRKSYDTKINQLERNLSSCQKSKTKYNKGIKSLTRLVNTLKAENKELKSDVERLKTSEEDLKRLNEELSRQAEPYESSSSECWEYRQYDSSSDEYW